MRAPVVLKFLRQLFMDLGRLNAIFVPLTDPLTFGIRKIIYIQLHYFIVPHGALKMQSFGEDKFL